MEIQTTNGIILTEINFESKIKSE